MSPEPMEVVSEQLRTLRVLAAEGLKIPDKLEPFMTLSFLALPVIPELKITDRGLFDVKRFEFTQIDVLDQKLT